MAGILTNSEPRIVAIGGGSGTSVLLRGLKALTPHLTAIVTMFDSGGSSGILRREFGYPPLGDIRQCLLALADDSDPGTAALRTAFDFRFSSSSSLNGHSLGNLVLAALTSINHGVEGAITELAPLLRMTGRVTPVTLENADLCAELADGSIIRSESAIDLRGTETPAIRRVFLDRHVRANPVAIDAILDADAVVLGPGDLYTSIVPNLLADGVPEALSKTGARLIYVCNLMTKRGETGDYDAADFAQAIVKHLDGRKLDYAIVNTESVPDRVLRAYAREGAQPVDPDGERLLEFTRNVVHGQLTNLGPPLRHDSTKLAEIVAGLAAAHHEHEAERPTAVLHGASD